tara:strand:+ start:56 stop:187 length:132 start_codon:yes stop_codon:yes gene_type:complete
LALQTLDFGAFLSQSQALMMLLSGWQAADIRSTPDDLFTIRER